MKDTVDFKCDGVTYRVPKKVRTEKVYYRGVPTTIEVVMYDIVKEEKEKKGKVSAWEVLSILLATFSLCVGFVYGLVWALTA